LLGNPREAKLTSSHRSEWPLVNLQTCSWNGARAVHFIRQHACDGIQVKDVLRVVPQSRTLLESRFKRLIGRTPHEEILRVRLNRVKELLVETDLSLDQIAEKTAFNHVEYLSVAFRREIGVPPSQFRAQNRP